MPIHDWSSVASGLFHHFHQTWSVAISDHLNAGVLPNELMALVEQRIAEKPTATIIRQSDGEFYSELANRILIKHSLGQIVAVIEILSPGNKAGRAAIKELVEKVSGLVQNGVHVMLIDLFGPTSRDPNGIHKLVWDEFQVEDFEFPQGKDRMVVFYEGNPGSVAYIEPVGLGDLLPDMPLILAKKLHIRVPLERIYMETWQKLPQVVKTAVESQGK